jgi:hypothetical protein
MDEPVRSDEHRVDRPQFDPGHRFRQILYPQDTAGLVVFPTVPDPAPTSRIGTPPVVRPCHGAAPR